MKTKQANDSVLSAENETSHSDYARLPAGLESAIGLIADERKRQTEIEEWTHEHDDEHDDGSLAIAAACYAIPHLINPLNLFENCRTGVFLSIKRFALWPWDMKWWKPSPENRVKELVKAGALIVAEIERLQRKEACR